VTGTAEIRVRAAPTDADCLAVWQVYEPVFGDQPTLEAWRETVWDKHRARDGFRLALALDGHAPVGFAYGYTGQPGQWWTDNAATVLPPEVAGSWLGGHFEVVSLGVLPQVRRAGVGRALMRALIEGLPHERLLLMTTSDAADPARQLYASEGWRVLGPGVGPATVIMGRRLVPVPATR